MASKSIQKRPGEPRGSEGYPCGRPSSVHSGSNADPEKLLAKMLGRLSEYVEKQSLNRSEAREKILRTIVLEARHFTAIDLLERLAKRHPEVGKATLYRNLPILVECGVLCEGPTDPDGQVLYELSEDEHHDHIFCLDCRRIFEFHDEGIEKRQEAVTSELRFETKGHRHVIYANCGYLKR
jgi:Fur family ferric uptake transcriptional regulator